VTDPESLGTAMMSFVGGRNARAFIGTGEEVREAGSPVERAEEIAAPVLLLHARKDANVPFQQSAALERALSRAGKDVELVEYEFAEHDISPERYRIDLLARLGEFLDEHL
jgi:dipeptidyl aminopeptidase/acylaminoacyl peptidase